MFRKTPTETYVAQTIERIEEQVVLAEKDLRRLRGDLVSEIENRLGSEPSSEAIVQELGSPHDWADEFVENGDYPSAEYSPNYLNERSERELFGLPLIHVTRGLRNGKPQTARGIIAVSDYRAVGFLALGGLAYGLVALGGMSIGLFSFGGFSIGLLFAIGGFALGGVSYGGFAAGIVAFGGFALGFLALGGMALGYYAFGGMAIGHTAVGGTAYGIYGKGEVEHVRFPLEDSTFQARFSELFQEHLALTIIVPQIMLFTTLAFLCTFTFCVNAWAHRRKTAREQNVH